jgi:D-serine deaminase-like pyridoxal phosphate-dependent protein
MPNFTEWNSLLASERLPVALVDLDAFDRNVAKIANWVRAPQTLRIATKSLRVPKLIERVLAYGAPYKGLMCFAAEEAELLASQGHDDFLIAYPTLQSPDLATVRNLHEQGKVVSLVVDSWQSIEHIDQAMTGTPRPFRLTLEMDLSLRLFGGRLHLGVRRSPIRTIPQALDLFERARPLKNIRLDGVMAYEAQVAGVGDRNPVNRFLHPIIRWMRAKSVRRIRATREKLASELRARGHQLTLFNGGGTGSLSYATEESSLTEVTAGSAFLLSHLFDHYSNLEPANLEPSGYFALQAVRTSDPGWVTCLGGGYVASGAPGWDKVPLPVYPSGAKLSPDEGAGEVQTPVRFPTGSEPKSGEPVYFRHAKAGELAERFNEYLLIQRGRAPVRVPTYRGLGKCLF